MSWAWWKPVVQWHWHQRRGAVALQKCPIPSWLSFLIWGKLWHTKNSQCETWVLNWKKLRLIKIVFLKTCCTLLWTLGLDRGGLAKSSNSTIKSYLFVYWSNFLTNYPNCEHLPRLPARGKLWPRYRSQSVTSQGANSQNSWRANFLKSEAAKQKWTSDLTQWGCFSQKSETSRREYWKRWAFWKLTSGSRILLLSRPKWKPCWDCVRSLESVFLFHLWRLTLGPFETISSHKKKMSVAACRAALWICSKQIYGFILWFFFIFF